MNWFWRSRRDEEIDRLKKHIAFLQKHCEESHKETLAKIGEVFQRDLEIDRLKKNSAGLLEALENFVNDIVPADPNNTLWVEARHAIARAKGVQP